MQAYAAASRRMRENIHLATSVYSLNVLKVCRGLSRRVDACIMYVKWIKFELHRFYCGTPCSNNLCFRVRSKDKKKQ